MVLYSCLHYFYAEFFYTFNENGTNFLPTNHGNQTFLLRHLDTHGPQKL
jgi:hypothetical protein